jgi:hypothetical protein
MVRNPSRELGKQLGRMNQRVRKLEENQGPVESGANLLLNSSQRLILRPERNVTKLILCDDSFVLDHPTLGELDSPTLKLDKAYCDFEDVIAETEYDYLSTDDGTTALFAGQGFVINDNVSNFELAVDNNDTLSGIIGAERNA